MRRLYKLGKSQSSVNVKTKNGYLFVQRSAGMNEPSEEDLSFTGGANQTG